MKDLKHERLLELLADQTVFGLNEEDLTELRQLKKDNPDWDDDVSLELAAAAISLSNINADADLPSSLRTKIFADADEFFSQKKESRETLDFAPNTTVTNDSSSARAAGNVVETKPNRPFRQWLGWGLAAAACLVLAITFWLTRIQPQPEISKTPEVSKTPETVKTPEIAQIAEPTKTPESVKSPEAVKTPETATTPESSMTPKNVKTPEIVRSPEPVKTPAPQLTAAQKREQLIASSPDVVQTSWASTKDDKTMSGDVVWSSTQQKGYVRLRNMPVLDVSKETYQLWIIDERNEKTPVSGGIFNVGSAGEIIIPINARLRITKPKQFAISKEKAGGVAVTKPDRIVAVAKI